MCSDFFRVVVMASLKTVKVDGRLMLGGRTQGLLDSKRAACVAHADDFA